jgi:hypothetical protein
MAQEFLDVLGMGALVKEQRRTRVTKVVEAYPRKSGPLEQRRKRSSAQVCGVDEGAYTGGEDEAVVAVEIAESSISSSWRSR